MQDLISIKKFLSYIFKN